jgi:tetratricopeptide (TPR) repeat protein
LYTILASLALGLMVGVVYTLLGWWKTWAMGIIVGLLVSMVSVVLASRWLSRRLEPRFLHAQKQIQAGAMQLALKSLEELLPMARWQIMLAGQIYAQMGLLAYAMDKEDLAFQYLEKSGYRISEARVTLAALYYRRSGLEKAKEVLEAAIKVNKKQVFLYNVHAWLLSKEGQQDAAVEQLRRCLEIEKDNETSKDNLLRLQNNRRMNMKRFGMQWYGLKLEKPPAALRPGHPPGLRKGFRVPKQNRHKG